MKIVIAPDSYKESLSALQVARAVEAGFRQVFPAADYVLVPVADGGAYAARLYETLARRHLADETLRVWPRVRIASPLAAGGQTTAAPPPARAMCSR